MKIPIFSRRQNPRPMSLPILHPLLRTPQLFKDGSSVESSLCYMGSLPDLAHSRSLPSGPDAFITPLRCADDVSEVTDDFRSKRSFAYSTLEWNARLFDQDRV